MLNSHRLLFILPDVSYNAELLPDKKPHAFTIQTCTQINGTFIDDKEFSSGNLSKLFTKLTSDEPLTIVLPDNLFSTHIVKIEEKGDAKIKEVLKSTTLPELKISPDTYEIQTTVLNELRGTTRVQITAILKELLIPLSAAAAQAKITVKAIAPLSWTIKGMVSLEPSVTLLQLGTHLYGALHYIGVDQTFDVPTDKIDEVITAIAKIKKSEPSTMTCYAVTNELVETALKDGLKQVLPLQQMTDQKHESDKLPASVATVIEQSQRTLMVPDFPVPQFELTAVSAAEAKEFAAMAAAAGSDEKPIVTEKSNQTEGVEEAKTAEPLPPPIVLAGAAKPVTAKNVDVEDVDTEEVEVKVVGSEKAVEKDEADKDDETEVINPVVAASTRAAAFTPTATIASPAVKASVVTSAINAAANPTEPTVDLRQFTSGSTSVTSSDTLKPVPIKNKSRSMSKMIIITLLVFIGTVALGVGVGMLVLRMSSNGAATTTQASPTPTPLPTVEPTPTPAEAASESATATGSASASPSPKTGSATATASATVTSQKVLVVNGTEKAGYAGQIKDKLTKAGFKSVSAGNAKGTYSDAGDFIFQKKSDEAAITAFEKATGLTLTTVDDAKAEDATGSYDVVIILNQ